MKVSFDASAVRSISAHQYAVRFALGGLVTLCTGLLADHIGASFGGLFLAFPALFTASATLIEKRERVRKERKGLSGTRRGRQAAALDAAGTVLGAIGLGCFASIVWLAATRVQAAAVLSVAGLAWLLISSGLWWLRKKHWRLTRIGLFARDARPR